MIIDDKGNNTKTLTFLSLGNILIAENTSSITAKLAKRALLYALTTSALLDSKLPAQAAFSLTATSRYSSAQFIGIMIDTGASQRSTAGYNQFLALQATNLPQFQLNDSTKGLVSVQFRIGSTSSISSINLTTLIGKVKFHIIKANTPFLLSLANLDRLKVYFNNLENTLVTPSKSFLVVQCYRHPFLLWNTSLQSFIIESFDYNPCFLSDIKLRQLY